MIKKNDLKTLIAICGATKAEFQRAMPPIQFLQQAPDKLGRLLERSYEKLSIIYPFLELGTGADELILNVSITDLARESNEPVVLERYALDTDECVALASLGIEALSIIEMSDLQTMFKRDFKLTPYATGLLQKYAFVHMDINCIEALHRAISQKDTVEWASFSIGFAQGLSHRAGIYLCMYWFASNTLPHFHLATEDMLVAIQEYTNEYINNSRRICQISSGPGFNRVEARVLSKLIDHPLFNYYLGGKSPKVAVPFEGPTD